ncbi:Ppx/GppA phosphatase family protein [Estrella lausannensis]|uniref:Putative exopolyphosphatase n=1 Tax=Estrella lausannensis TaxID=483423 RepID=A0A0H5DR97_9BACT|nr:hypothetical protein [Estrella lausannensis]CRX38698.1 Putative exopolyphosphatase [Estrella lausannensis]
MHLIYLFIFSMFLATGIEAEIVRRAAIDIGSGSTKVAIAEVDTETNQITEVLLDASYPVPYQAALDHSADSTFDEETKFEGLRVFKEIKTIADQFEVRQVVAVATSAFRKANNVRPFLSQIKNETGIEVLIIPQREEGEIAFFSALASGDLNSQEVLVWDIGTGSQQMTVMNEKGELVVYMGENMGSVEFKHYIMDVIQSDETDISPNPISDEEYKIADSYGRAFGRRATPLIKQKIQENISVVGIGRLFYNSIRPIAAKDGVINRKGLRTFIAASLNKTDQELNNPFAHVDVSNAILVLAIMKALHIQTIRPLETTSTRGLLINPACWESSARLESSAPAA